MLDSVPIDQETKEVLLGRGTRLRPLYQLMLAQESGDWQGAAELAKSLNLRESEVAEVLLAGDAVGASGERQLM